MNYPKNSASDKLCHIPAIFRTDDGEGGARTGMHRHSAVEITHIVSGSGKCTGGSGIYAFESGDVFMFSPNEAHKFDFESTSFETLTVQLEPRFIWTSGADLPDSSLLQIFFDKNNNFENKIPKEHPAARETARLMLEAEQELLNKDKEYFIALKIKIVSILLTLLRSFNYIKKKNHTSSRSYNLEGLERTMNYIDTHLGSELDLTMLAENALLSRSHFCTVFKRYNGVTPWDYITIRRIEKAVEILEQSEKTKMQIALECGFNNTANFYRAFKKVTGCSPSDIQPPCGR